MIPPTGLGTRNMGAAAAAAKSLQSCPTLCDPIDGSPPGSSVPGILQARTLEWVAAWVELVFCLQEGQWTAGLATSSVCCKKASFHRERMDHGGANQRLYRMGQALSLKRTIKFYIWYSQQRCDIHHLFTNFWQRADCFGDHTQGINKM